MVIHIGMLTLAETATTQDRQAIADGLAAMIGEVDGLESVRVGLDLGLAPGNADLIFLLEFATDADRQAYATHPAHKALIAERIAPVLASKAFVQVDAFQEARP